MTAKPRDVLLIAALLAVVAALTLMTNSETHAQTLSTPTINASARQGGAIELSWNAVSSAARYELWAWTSAGGWKRLDDGALTGASYRHTGLTAGTKYWFTIRAVATDGTVSDWSAYATATALSAAAFTPTVTAVPGADTPTVTPTTFTLSVPTLTATLSGTNAVDLSWSAVSGAVRYNLWAWTSAGGWEQLDNGALTGTSYRHTGLAVGTTYWYALRSVAANGAASDWSEYPSVTVSATQGPTATATATVTPTPTFTTTPDAAAERAALVALYQATDGANWTHNDNWLSDKPLSTWYGVLVDESGHVVRVVLERNGLNGSLPDLSALTNLTRLLLARNELSGQIPNLSALTKLENLDLSFNELSGQIPDVSALTNLLRLELGNNALSGQIPDLRALTNLERVDLTSNELTGPFPDVSGLTNLWWLLISDNKLSGPIPHLRALTNLRWLSAGYNTFSGPFPDLDALTNLKFLNLVFNELSGPIPVLPSFTNLQWLLLGSNELSGSFPELSSLVQLGQLDLSYNVLSGPIGDLTGLTRLTWVDLAGNQLCLPDSAALSHSNANVAAHLQGLALPSCTGFSTPTSTVMPGPTPTPTPTATVSAQSAPVLTATLSGTNAIDLSWTAVAGAVRYELWTEVVNVSGWQRLDNGRLTDTRFKHNGLTHGTRYRYAVIAIDSNSQRLGAWSNYPTLTVPASGAATATASPTAAAGYTATPTATPTATTVPPAPAAERSALVALYNAADGANWTHNDNWLTDKPLSNWYGVFVDDGGHVARLVLDRNGLSGPLPDLSALSNLTELELSYNDLSGSIPDLSKLNKLWDLEITHNKLSGQIPDVSALTNLRQLELSRNNLSGQIPDLSALTNLERLDLEGNALSGQIPDLSALTNLWWILLGDNELTGKIPDLSALTRLRWLSLNNNEFSGSFPDLSALTNLFSLNLRFNKFSGPFPDLSALTNLANLYLDNNQLSGSITNLSALTSLRKLGLESNQLTGQIPDLSALTDLEWVNLRANQLTGQIPNVNTLVNLTTLHLDSNDLDGSIPDVSALTELSRLNLSDNKLTGPILNLNHLTRLTWLDLSNNQLRGPFPDLSNLGRLTGLNLNNNSLCQPPGFSLSGSNTVVAAHLNSLNLPTCTNEETMLTLAVPQNLTTAVGTGEVVLTWGAVTNATSYELRAWDSIDHRWGSIGGVLAATTYTHTVQTDGRNYYYQVRAGDVNGVHSAWSDRVYAAVTPSDFPPPPLSLGLDLSFQKHFDVDGVVVVATGDVSDALMVQARAIITGMLISRSDLLATMADNNTRIHMESDRRGGISNKGTGLWTVYLASNDPNCQTFIHELGHLVHYAIEEQTDGEQFNTRLHALFQAALNAGRWTGHYAATIYSEYWAEMVQFWFQEAMPPPLDATYAKLEDYDPEAAKLVEEVFGDTATVPAGCKP